MSELLSTKWWVSHPKFTGMVTVDNNTDIIQACPVVWYRFIGQPLANLKRWLNSLGPGLRIAKLEGTAYVQPKPHRSNFSA